MNSTNLSSEQIKESNYLLFEQLDPTIPHFLDGLTESFDSFTFSVTRSDDLTVQINKNFLHSAYAPKKEAKKYITSFFEKSMDIFIVIGFGLGYHIESLAEKITINQKILIIEPEPFLLKQVLSNRKIEFTATENIYFITGSNIKIILEKIRAFLPVLFSNPKEVFRFKIASFYERSETLQKKCAGIQQFIAENIAFFQKEQAKIFEDMNTLRLSELSKTFLGEYKNALEIFKSHIKNGLFINKKEIVLLAAYFLISYGSYSEAFEKGRANE